MSNNAFDEAAKERLQQKMEVADAKGEELGAERDKIKNFAADPNERADEWQDESFGTSDPPSNY